MYQRHKLRRDRRRTGISKAGILLLAMVLVLTVAGGSTLAFLSTVSDEVNNTFTATPVSCQVTEAFDGTTKKNVNVTNIGETHAYIRVKLITYRVKVTDVPDGEDIVTRIGGVAVIPAFSLGAGWIKAEDDYYYYTAPVAPGASPAVPLIGDSGIALQSYHDSDGGVQVIEVMAEAFQARGVDDNGDPAVETVWPVKVDEHGTLSLNTSSGLAE